MTYFDEEKVVDGEEAPSETPVTETPAPEASDEAGEVEDVPSEPAIA